MVRGCVTCSAGISVAINGDQAIVGAFDARKAFIFQKTDGVWGTTAVATIDGYTSFSYFGATARHHAILSLHSLTGCMGSRAVGALSGAARRGGVRQCAPVACSAPQGESLQWTATTPS